MTNDSDEYTPTTEQVRNDYAAKNYYRPGDGFAGAEFDRWLGGLKAEWQAEAYELGRDHEFRYSVMQQGEVPTNPYRTT